MENINNFVSEYFFIAQKVSKTYNKDSIVVLQFFQKKETGILSGINEVIDFLKNNLSTKDLIIRYLPEGSKIGYREVVLELEGKYHEFGIFEGIIDGILSRATSLATNAYECVVAAKGKEIIAMSDRSDHYTNLKRDGKAFLIGGITSFSGHAQCPDPKYTVYGSIPHALIQNFNGDLVQTMIHYQSLYPKDELVALVDFHNDVISDSLKVLKHFQKDLKGVRVDTSIDLRDKMFNDNENEFGVTPNQIKRLRKALDENNGEHVKIFVSSGFCPKKIKEFEDENTPVDGYGVGEFLLKINHTFSGDVTLINGKELAKVGRKYQKNIKLIEYRFNK